MHLGLAEERYKDAHYVGALFVLGALGLLVGAAVAAGGDSFGRLVVWAWAMGSVICGAMLVGFLLSRTVGLPGYHRHDWPPEQIVALAFEAVYLVAFGVALRHRSRLA